MTSLYYQQFIRRVYTGKLLHVGGFTRPAVMTTEEGVKLPEDGVPVTRIQ